MALLRSVSLRISAGIWFSSRGVRRVEEVVGSWRAVELSFVLSVVVEAF